MYYVVHLIQYTIIHASLIICYSILDASQLTYVFKGAVLSPKFVNFLWLWPKFSVIFCWKWYSVLIFRSQINLCLQMVQLFSRISYFYVFWSKKFDSLQISRHFRPFSFKSSLKWAIYELRPRQQRWRHYEQHGNNQWEQQ